MNTRKSSRRSAVAESLGIKAKHPNTLARHDTKRRKVQGTALPTLESNSYIDDKIDPVEKLLSFSHVNNDIMLLMNDTEQAAAASLNQGTAFANSLYPNISYNFNKVINDSMRLYYLKFYKTHMEIHNDHSLFSVLNEPPHVERPPVAQDPLCLTPRFQVQFFGNVNFNPKLAFGQIEDYIRYGGDNELSTDSEHEEIASLKDMVETPISSLSGKMSFRYRQNDKLNLSLTDELCALESAPTDALKYLNQLSVLSGRASEMIGTSNFLVTDFFF